MRFSSHFHVFFYFRLVICDGITDHHFLFFHFFFPPPPPPVFLPIDFSSSSNPPFIPFITFLSHLSYNAHHRRLLRDPHGCHFFRQPVYRRMPARYREEWFVIRTLLVVEVHMRVIGKWH
jgi:hypothetical protein